MRYLVEVVAILFVPLRGKSIIDIFSIILKRKNKSRTRGCFFCHNLDDYYDDYLSQVTDTLRVLIFLGH